MVGTNGATYNADRIIISLSRTYPTLTSFTPKSVYPLSHIPIFKHRLSHTYHFPTSSAGACTNVWDSVDRDKPK